MRLVYIFRGQHIGNYAAKINQPTAQVCRVLLSTGVEVKVSIYDCEKVENSLRKYGDARAYWKEEICAIQLKRRKNFYTWTKLDTSAEYIAWCNLGLTQKYQAIDKQIEELSAENDRLLDLITWSQFAIEQQNQEIRLTELWKFYSEKISEDEFIRADNTSYGAGMQRKLF